MAHAQKSTLIHLTPAKVTLLLAVAVAIAVGTSQHQAASHPLASTEWAYLPTTSALGQDNGSLTSNFDLETSLTRTPVAHGPDRRSLPPVEPRNPPGTIRRSYPPLAR